MSSSVEITSKRCTYGCGVEIYWKTDENTYFELSTRKKHICPNRVANKKSSITPPSIDTSKPTYYNNKKSYYSNQPKPKMSNSLELLQGSIADIQRKYEILSDIVTEYNGKIHGSQSHIVNVENNSISLIVYYEVPEGQRDQVKQKFNNFILSVIV